MPPSASEGKFPWWVWCWLGQRFSTVTWQRGEVVFLHFLRAVSVNWELCHMWAQQAAMNFSPGVCKILSLKVRCRSAYSSHPQPLTFRFGYMTACGMTTSLSSISTTNFCAKVGLPHRTLQRRSAAIGDFRRRLPFTAPSPGWCPVGEERPGWNIQTRAVSWRGRCHNRHKIATVIAFCIVWRR